MIKMVAKGFFTNNVVWIDPYVQSNLRLFELFIIVVSTFDAFGCFEDSNRRVV